MRALAGGIEIAQRFNLIAEELDAKRVIGLWRENVENPAAERVLADLVNRLTGLVAYASEMVYQVIQAELVARL